MNITPPNDSASLTHLNIPAEIRQAITRPIPKVEHSSSIKAINDEEKSQQQPRNRRQKERRQKREASILDTRATQERRSALNQEKSEGSMGQGIDVMA